MGRPHETDETDPAEEIHVAEANGNGVEHHSPLKSNSGPSERSQEPRKPENSASDAAMSSPSGDDAAPENGKKRPPTKNGNAAGSKDIDPEVEMARFVKMRMWFVRLPNKPALSPEEHKEFENQRRKLADAIQEGTIKIDSKKAARDQMRKLRDQQLVTAKAFREAVSAKDREIEPYRKERQQRKQATTQIKSLHADVQFRSEEELEAAIRAADYRMTHESISKAEENALFKQIQKLQAQRPAVRKAAEERAKTAAANEALKAEKQALKLSSDEAWALESALLMEREALHADRVAQSAIFDEYKADADLLDKEVKALLDERKKNKKALAELNEANIRKMGPLLEDSRANRRFSQEVRGYIKAGKVEFARTKCAEETDKQLKKLANDEDFRRNYLSLWAKQHEAEAAARKEELERQAAARKEEQKRDGASTADQAKKKDEADDVIDAALKSVKYSVKDRGYPSEPAKAPADAAAAGDAAEGPAVANGHTSESEQPEAHEPAEARKTLGAQQMEELAENSGAPAKAKGPRRSKVEKKAVVEIPAIINDKTPFVPPAAFLKRDVEAVDEEEERERARLRNVEAAREAEARKERKRRKAEQKARTQKTRAAATKEDEKATKEPAAPAAEELPAVVPAAEVPQASAPASAAVAAAPKPSGGGGKPAGRVGKHIGAPVAKSRVQVNRRKGTLQRALAYVQQQLPKSWMHRLLMVGLALLAIWLLTELLPRRVRA